MAVVSSVDDFNDNSVETPTGQCQTEECGKLEVIEVYSWEVVYYLEDKLIREINQ
jgi:hypothetical protein